VKYLGNRIFIRSLSKRKYQNVARECQCNRYLDNNVIDNLRGQASEMILGGTKITIQWMIHRPSGSLLNHIARRHASRATTCTCDVYTGHIGATKGMRDGVSHGMESREERKNRSKNRPRLYHQN